MSNMNWNKLKNNDIHVARGTSFGYDELPQVGSFQDQARVGVKKPVTKKPLIAPVVQGIEVDTDKIKMMEVFRKLMHEAKILASNRYEFVLKMKKVTPLQSAAAWTDKSRVTKFISDNLTINESDKNSIVNFAISGSVEAVKSLNSWPDDAYELHSKLIRCHNFGREDSAFWITVFGFAFDKTHIINPLIQEKSQSQSMEVKIKDAVLIIDGCKNVNPGEYINVKYEYKYFYRELVKGISKYGTTLNKSIDSKSLVIFNSKIRRHSISIKIIDGYKLIVLRTDKTPDEKLISEYLKSTRSIWEINASYELSITGQGSWIVFNDNVSINFKKTINGLHRLSLSLDLFLKN